MRTEEPQAAQTLPAGAYSRLASYYDRLMSEQGGFADIGRQLQGAWARFHANPRRILELGAGTCPLSALGVYPAGAQVLYSDLSRFMLAQNRPSAGLDFRVAADIRRLPFKGSFDLVVMTTNVFNYLLNRRDIDLCLKEVGGILAPGGLFLFDVVCLGALKLKPAVAVHRFDDCTCFWDIRYDEARQTRRHTFGFITQVAPGTVEKAKESHEQRVYGLDSIRQAAKQAGFEALGCFEGHTLQPGSDSSRSALLAFRKDNPA